MIQKSRARSSSMQRILGLAFFVTLATVYAVLHHVFHLTWALGMNPSASHLVTDDPLASFLILQELAGPPVPELRGINVRLADLQQDMDIQQIRADLGIRLEESDLSSYRSSMINR